MDEPPASTSNPAAPAAPAASSSPQQQPQDCDPKRAPVPSIELSVYSREIHPFSPTPPFRDGPLPSRTPGRSQCSDSSPRARPRTPSTPLRVPTPSFAIGASDLHIPSGSPRILEPEPRWYRRDRASQVDELRHVPDSPNTPTKLALSPPTLPHALSTSTSVTLPAIRAVEAVHSLPSLSTITSAVPAMQNTSTFNAASTPHQRESAPSNAMEDNNSAATPITAQSPGPSTAESFCPDARHILSTSPESIEYWEAILDRCNTSTRITKPSIGGRDVFVIGNITVKSDHLDPRGGSGYHLLDANEVAAVKLVKDAIPGIQVPQTYFNSKIRGHDILIQSRIPGQPLGEIWPSLTTPQKEGFKSQARDIILKLRRITPDTLKYPRYFVAGSHKESQRKLSAEEVHSLSPTDTCEDLGVAHNDMVMSNIIVNDDRIVGLIGWSNAGYFNWRTVSRIHAKVRCVDSKTNAPIPEYHESRVPWHDLYEHPQESKRIETDEMATPKVSTPIAEPNPLLPSEEGSSQTPALTPRKVADMKRSSVSRASSVERSSPAPSLNSQPVTKKKGPSAASIKKGQPNESQSAAGSPAPEHKGPKKARLRRGKLNSEDDDEDIDESALFCICRKPDNHTWMIACDGGCEDWFHGRCMNIDPKDADLIDKYICPTCETKSRCVQLGNQCVASRMSHVSSSRQLSSSTDEQNNRKHENEASRGGILNLGELKSVVSKVDSADQFRKLGASPLSARQEEVQARLSDAMASPGPNQNDSQTEDVNFDSEADKVSFSSSERQRLNQLRKEKLKLDNRKEMLQARDNFIVIAKQRVKHAFDRLKTHGSVGNLQLKDICGFDNRFSLSDEEFDEWRKSEKGALLLADFSQENAGEASPQLKSAVDAESVEELLQTLCLKKRCERHKQWIKVMQQEVLFEQSLLKEQSDKCHKDAEELVKKAVLRMFSGEN
ncbi:protein kinase subdomain-containing protein [Trichophyton equinum CBS 127.97]|uniref:Protein kinase subdomain-containing protein n=1 Tax=Trichophyton equinum (strain ATCC MYA-4606 / CBS 127.97) TaxID=559882 RepID=F2PJD0_TRIEC|nr:protein kinase subdomain-containing protein [Trichophyton equinum CBS 127.97]